MDTNCPYCGSKSHRAKKVKNGKVQRVCLNPKCARYFTTKDELITADTRKKLPKILLLDIETAPLKAFVWQTQVYNGNVSADKVISEWFILTWAAKWLFSSKIESDGLTSKEAKNEDDGRIVRSLWELLNEADIVVAHNGVKFDVPNINTRFLIHDLPPCKPYQQIDTLLVARKQFGFTHNNLNALAKLFGLPEKLDTNFELWKECLDGDAKSLKYMQEYNRRDVEVLEEVYLKMRSWVKGHPNLGLYVESNDSACTICGSHKLYVHGHYFTNAGKFKVYACKNCGALSRSRVNEYPKDKKGNLLISMYR